MAKKIDENDVPLAGCDDPTTSAYGNNDLHPNFSKEAEATLGFAFWFRELSEIFDIADKKAGRARKANRRLGVASVLFVSGALIYASIAPVLHYYHVLAEWEEGLALAAAVAGIVGAGLGALPFLQTWRPKVFGTQQRKAWLKHRYETEMLRQFHFQYIAARLPEIESAMNDPTLQEAYKAKRLEVFRRFEQAELADLDAGFKRAASVAPVEPFSLIEKLDPKDLSPKADPALGLWRLMRLCWQWGYARSKLRHKSTDRRPSPRQAERRFSMVAWTAIVAVIVLHVGNAVAGPLGVPRVVLDALVVAAALISLTVRALEDGFRPSNEVERYELFRANVQVTQQGFDREPRAIKVELMRNFENMAFEEMCTFLRTHSHAKFLL